MFCTKCGNKLNENGVCPNCSNMNNVNQNNNMVKVTISRVSRFFGVAVNYKVYVDGNEVAVLSNGSSKEIMLSAGPHNFVFDMWSASSSEQIEIPSNCKEFYIDTKLAMGLITNKIKVVSTRSV